MGEKEPHEFRKNALDILLTFPEMGEMGNSEQGGKRMVKLELKLRTQFRSNPEYRNQPRKESQNHGW